MRIVDRQLRRFIEALGNGTKCLDDENVQDLAAAVGDSTGRNEAQTREALVGKSRREQFDLARPGLGQAELKDLKTFLRSASGDGFTLTPRAKNFVEALAGESPLQDDKGFVADERGIRGLGLTSSGTVTALNMSDIVDGRRRITEGEVVGTVDSNGAITSPAITTNGPTGQPRTMDPGDWLRIGVRAGSGEPEWFSVQVAGSDVTAPLKANTDRIDLALRSPGVVEVSHNTPRPMAEPFARLRLTNLTTGTTTDFQSNEKGSFEPFTVAGETGQRFEIAISDGVNNRDFTDRTLIGQLQVSGGTGHTFDLPDPALHGDDVGRGYRLARFTGPTIVDGIHYTDPVQGALANCFEPAGMSAAAWADPQAVADAIREIEVVGEGGERSKKYQVTFYEVAEDGRSTTVTQEVDGDLWVRSSRTPLYGSTYNTPRDPAQMELWYSIFEKARAQWKGSYHVTGEGGHPGDVMSETLGRPYDYHSVTPRKAKRLFEKIRTGVSQAAQGRKNWAMTAGTYGDSEEHRYTGKGVYSNHAYTVTGASEENGVKYVHLRNPWGQSEPAGNGPDDGEFKLTLDDFVFLFEDLSLLDPNPPAPDVEPRMAPLMAWPQEPSPAPFMTDAQRELDQLLRVVEQNPQQALGEALNGWLVDTYGGGAPAGPTSTALESQVDQLGVDAVVARMSLGAALQALKDLRRFEQRIGELEDANRGAGFESSALTSLRAKLEAAVARERAAIIANRER